MYSLGYSQRTLSLHSTKILAHPWFVLVNYDGIIRQVTKKIGCLYSIEYYRDIKKNEIVSFTKKWMAPHARWNKPCLFFFFFFKAKGSPETGRRPTGGERGPQEGGYWEDGYDQSVWHICLKPIVLYNECTVMKIGDVTDWQGGQGGAGAQVWNFLHYAQYLFL